MKAETIQFISVAELMPEFEKLHAQINELQQTEKPLTVAKLAEYLSCSKPTVFKLMNQGLPFTRVGADPRFYQSDVDAWLKNQNK